MYPLLSVDQKEDHVGFGHGHHRLLADRDVEGLVTALDDPARIDDEEVVPGPVGPRKIPITRDAGLVVDDGDPLPDDPVEEGRLADVGAAHDGHDRQASAHGAAPSRSAAVIS